MHLTKGERAILSYYHTLQQAQMAIQELKAAGINDIALDKIAKQTVGEKPYDDLYNLHEAAYLSSQVMDIRSTAEETNYSIPDLMDHYYYMLTAVVPGNLSAQAISIVKKYAYIVN